MPTPERVWLEDPEGGPDVEYVRGDVHAQLLKEEKLLRDALRVLDQAITVPGPSPTYHAMILRRHRAEWPHLWRVIDAARRALEAHP